MMPIKRTLTRRQVLRAGGGVALAASAAVAAGHPLAAAATTGHRTKFGDLYDIGWCTILNDGKWIGPRNADGSIDRSLIDDIVQKAKGYARPKFLRVTEASYVVGTEIPAVGTEEYDILRELVDAGVKVGVAINVLRKPEPQQGCDPGWDDPVVAGRCVRTAEDSIGQAHTIKAAAGDIYDWIFLDFAWGRTPAGVYGLNDLQQIVDGIHDAGWPRIMINATGFDTDQLTYLPRRVWGIAKHFQLLYGDDWQTNVAQVIDGNASAIETEDLEFTDFIAKYRPESYPILKFEIPTQIQEFKQLSAADQNTLLALWAQAQQTDRYTMIYPLFVHGDMPLGNQARQYDSRSVGTFWPQRRLMYRYDNPAK